MERNSIQKKMLCALDSSDPDHTRKLGKKTLAERWPVGNFVFKPRKAGKISEKGKWKKVAPTDRLIRAANETLS